MSDAMTNREIEDVLTSIRRLVAQDGGRSASADRLVLTEAQRIDVAAASEGQLDHPAAAPAEPSDHSAPESGKDAVLPPPDFGKLEATIAELEAAVSAIGDTFESENSDDTGPTLSNVTELYGRLSFKSSKQDNTVEDAETVAVSSSDEPAPSATEGRPAQVPSSERTENHSPDMSVAMDAAHASDLEDTILDEAALRTLIAQIVREELHGQLGERITQQVRKLVRVEIAKALDERNYL